jgi:hypothetical protein
VRKHWRATTYVLMSAFYKNSYKKSGLNWSFAHRTIDTHSLAYMHMSIHGKRIPVVNAHSGITSNLLFSYVGLDTIRDTHNALEDARLTAEAINRLLFNASLLPEYRKIPCLGKKLQKNDVSLMMGVTP